jgi:hypothetical protein
MKSGAMGVIPRQLRIDYPGTVHHVMSRGNREAADDPVAQEHRETGGIGEFQERDCQAAQLGPTQWENGRSHCGNLKAKKSYQEKEPN